MMRFALSLLLLFSALFANGINSARANSLTISLVGATNNPASPQMGDNLVFHSVIRNSSSEQAEGLIAWISLVQIDKGKEQPMDLEDWSAHKAVTAAILLPGKTLQSDWPMRLIQSGQYRVVVSVVSRNGAGLTASPFVDFNVRQKPVVESNRVLPVALGVPIVILGFALAMRFSR